MKVGDLNFSMSISGASSVEDATDDVARSMEGVEEATDDAAAAQSKAQSELRETGEAAEQAAQAQRDFSGTTGQASNVLTSVTDGLADARFGLAGAANNASFAAESFADLAAQTGGAGAAVKALGSSLAGPLGIVVAFQSLVALAPAVIDFFSDTEEAAKGAGDEIEDTASAVSSFAEQIQSAGRTDEVVARLQNIRDQLGRGIFGGFTEEFEQFGVTSVEEATRVREAIGALIGRLQTDPQEQEFFTALTDLEVPPNIAQDLAEIAAAGDQANEEINELPERPEVDLQQPDSEPISPDLQFEGLLENANAEQVREALGANLIQSVSGADQALQSLQTSFQNATSQEQRTRIQALISRVERLKQSFTRAGQQTTRFQQLGQQAQARLRQGFLQVGGSIGNAISGLVSGQSAFQSFAQAGKQAIQQLISQLASLAIKAAVIAPLIGALGLGTGGAGLALPGVAGQVGGGPLPGPASGGMIEESGIAKVHKGEAVVNREMMRGMDTGDTSRTRSTRLVGGDVVIPGALIDQARQSGQRTRSRTGRTP